MDGALDCSLASSAVNSSGSTSGTVAKICATFINGPFSAPRMAWSASA